MQFTSLKANSMAIDVIVETTRNPDSVIFRVNKTLVPPGTGQAFPNAEMARNNPLAAALFQIQGIASLWIIGSEVMVTKEERTGWGRVKSRVVETLKNSLG
ncbi:MAG: NifU N-terminal domain-containing protein [Nitrospinaceae bacterium]